MTQSEITFKSLDKKQLDNLKNLYIEERVKGMTEEELRKFVTEILDIQIRGTVGNEEEREAWKEMKEYFGDSFELVLKIVMKAEGKEGSELSDDEKEYQKRIQVLEKQKDRNSSKTNDMWDDG